MSITEILDAVAPAEYTRALAWMHFVAAHAEVSALVIDDVPDLVTALSQEA
jgi:hypothetical protein